MPDIFNLTEEMNSYFKSLPHGIQENIIQSGAKINSLADLKEIAGSLKGEADESAAGQE